MKPDARAVGCLQDMLEYAQHACDFVAGTDRAAFERDIEKQFALARALEIMGEAAKGVPEEIRNLAPTVPWRQIAAMRDKLIHHYFGADLEIVWLTAVDDAPALIREIGALLSRLSSGDQDG